MNIAVTGGAGFIGRALGSHLGAQGHKVVPIVRIASGLSGEVLVGTIDAATSWHAALAGCDAVVHLAARVHVMRDTASDPLVKYQATNRDATLHLARQAAQAGVTRFIFISSIKVNGEGRDTPYCETDVPAPEDAYAMSKWEAEQGLADIAQQTGLEIVILRPPLVYGPGVGANFLRLMHTVQRGWPLPLGAIHNRRSLLYLGNLIDAIRLCIEHPGAAGQTFLLDDGEAISTPALIRALADALDRPAHLLSIPISLLELAGRVTGKSAAISRLTASLHVDSRAIRAQFGWLPPYSMREGLAQTVAAFRSK